MIPQRTALVKFNDSSLLKFHSASAIGISLKRFVIFKVRVNLTHIALFVAFVDFGFGILSVPVRELL
ncbi:hypothetical protein [Campylobacter sp.]|uniref:hypothetical protein n=1 Tax=Campylobacter sp. TaxID=205 RepID=UPI0025E08BE6|nr:hypothetical protein [Campylobacter sp.]